MSDIGWKCPVCGRGCSPDLRVCDHDGEVWRMTRPAAEDDGMCSACRPPLGSGSCGCYRPERDMVKL